ncbi:MAG TPA: GvpL/GvpF family gas vesicle protein [Thermoanaerobaculia bacterium]|nr:GvpL/GvpF family gas vesicle protein [Thermoanaerobaculia bacterium]
MSPLYLYALAGSFPEDVPVGGCSVEGWNRDDPFLPRTPLGVGLAGEPLLLVPCGGFSAIVGEIAARPAVTAAALARHDETVRRLANLIPALLPARFGEWLPDARALSESLAPRAGEITRALILVEGCVQMTLRVFGEPAVPEVAIAAPVEEEPAGGPGTRYLAARRRATAPGIPGLPEVAALRRALRPLVRAERIERHEKGRLLASVHDLVVRAEASGYVRIVEGAAGELAGRKVTVSGPWPPYAFAPGGL